MIVPMYIWSYYANYYLSLQKLIVFTVYRIGCDRIDNGATLSSGDFTLKIELRDQGYINGST
jgi:hypothetical protein